MDSHTTYWRVCRIAIQQSEQLQIQFMAEISMYDPDILVWIDETGSARRNSIWQYGYSLRGMPARVHQLQIVDESVFQQRNSIRVCSYSLRDQLKVRKARINAIGIMSYQRVEDVYLTEENINGDNFVGSCLLPILTVTG